MRTRGTTASATVDARAILTRSSWAATSGIALWAAIQINGWTGWIVLFLLLPDLPLLVAGGGDLDRGQLHPRAVPWYNATHHPLPALLAVSASAVLLRYGPTMPAIAALAWLAHIALDHSLGYGLRDRNGHQRTTRRGTVPTAGAQEAQPLQPSAGGAR